MVSPVFYFDCRNVNFLSKMERGTRRSREISKRKVKKKKYLIYILIFFFFVIVYNVVFSKTNDNVSLQSKCLGHTLTWKPLEEDFRHFRKEKKSFKSSMEKLGGVCISSTDDTLGVLN
jgi:hypothetical protein